MVNSDSIREHGVLQDEPSPPETTSRPRVSHQDVERHIARARALQSRELARLTRRLLHRAAHLPGISRGDRVHLPVRARHARGIVRGPGPGPLVRPLPCSAGPRPPSRSPEPRVPILRKPDRSSRPASGRPPARRHARLLPLPHRPRARDRARHARARRHRGGQRAVRLSLPRTPARLDDEREHGGRARGVSRSPRHGAARHGPGRRPGASRLDARHPGDDQPRARARARQRRALARSPLRAAPEHVVFRERLRRAHLAEGSGRPATRSARR